MKTIKDFSNYSITPEGKVYNRHGREIVSHNNGKGYYQVLLINDAGEKKKCYVHVLVAKAYLPNFENKPEVNHMDNVKSNNNLSNLEWVWPAENRAHAKQFRACSSKYIGVSWSKERGKWHARIKIGNFYKHVGYFIEEEEARDAYLAEAKQLNRTNKYAI